MTYWSKFSIILNMKKIILAALIVPGIVQSQESYCDYENNVKTFYENKIQSVSMVKKTVRPYVDDLRICHVSAKIKMKGDWHWVDGEYAFNTDMTEEDACSRALHRAKEQVMRENSMEFITSSSDMVCKNTESVAVTYNDSGRMSCRKDAYGVYYCR